MLEAVAKTRLRLNLAAAVFVATVWCQERRNGVLPPGLIPAARETARRGEKLDAEEASLLLSVAVRTGDKGLAALIKQRHGPVIEEKWKGVEEAYQKCSDAYLELCRGSILNMVAAKPTNQLAYGTTIRRAVARHGRNDPCHCGSGKKYKHCCHDKDQERLHHASEVAGRTQ